MKATLYTGNGTSQTPADGGIIALGNIIRRSGCGLTLRGNGINVAANGYYTVNAAFTVQGTGTGSGTITMYMDGIPVENATTTSATSAATLNTVGLNAVVRKTCCVAPSVITFVFTGTNASITNVAVTVVKE